MFVLSEIDYPPKANAGSDIIIHLPQKSVTLCGNSSTDDRGIASYEWIKMSDSKTVDMTVSVDVVMCCGSQFASSGGPAVDSAF